MRNRRIIEEDKMKNLYQRLKNNIGKTLYTGLATIALSSCRANEGTKPIEPTTQPKIKNKLHTA